MRRAGPSQDHRAYGHGNNLLTLFILFMLFWGIRQHIRAPGNLKENCYVESRFLCF